MSLMRAAHQNKIYDVIVIGGGASGMMAAGVAAERGRSVLLIEKNDELGKKLKITGGGRCNITNNEQDLHKLLASYGKAKDSLYSLFTQFGVLDTFKFFESRGLPLVTQNLNRVFPKTEKAMDVFRVMEQFISNENITLQMGTKVKGLIKNENKIIGVNTDKGEFKARNIIISTGGASHPETGSTGDGFKMLKDLGHTVADPSPSLVPLSVMDNWVKTHSGTALDDIKITFRVDGVKSFHKRGRILLTHFGLSGPLIINSSKKVSDLLHEGRVTAEVDLCPTVDIGTLDKELLDVFDANKNKILKNILKELQDIAPAPLLESLLGEEELETKVHSISKEGRRDIVNKIKTFEIHIDGLMGFDKAIIADGGVPTQEIDMRTCASKIYPNLFVTGDIFNIVRPSGGYSLQLCWTTGFVAGKNID